MKAKFNLTLLEFQQALRDYWANQGWDIKDFERIEVFKNDNVIVWTKGSVKPLGIYAEVEQEEID